MITHVKILSSNKNYLRIISGYEKNTVKVRTYTGRI